MSSTNIRADPICTLSCVWGLADGGGFGHVVARRPSKIGRTIAQPIVVVSVCGFGFGAAACDFGSCVPLKLGDLIVGMGKYQNAKIYPFVSFVCARVFVCFKLNVRCPRMGPSSCFLPILFGLWRCCILCLCLCLLKRQAAPTSIIFRRVTRPEVLQRQRRASKREWAMFKRGCRVRRLFLPSAV